VVKEALPINISKVIIAHSHTSGNTDLLPQDIKMTKKPKEILRIIDVKVLNQITAGDDLLSFADLGIQISVNSA
jgi:DNA repair protein RadC